MKKLSLQLLSETVIAKRKALNLSQAQLAEKANMNPQPDRHPGWSLSLQKRGFHHRLRPHQYCREQSYPERLYRGQSAGNRRRVRKQ